MDRSLRQGGSDTLAASRLRHQRLVGPRLDTPACAVRWLGAVQAQDYHGASWGLALRSHAVDGADIDRAFNAGAFLRTHVLRPTWHFVAPEDIRWMLALTSPRVHAVNAYMYRKLEIDDALCGRAHRLFERALAGGGTATRVELASTLEVNGIRASGMRLAYIVMHGELSGVLCSGALRGKQHTYALLEERVAPAPVLSRDASLAALARRFFTSHGPATEHDFAWWSGLTVHDARTGLAHLGRDVERMDADGASMWTVEPAPDVALDGPVVHLLPNYDQHVIAYREHAHTLDPAARAALRVRTDGPLDAHLITRNGLVVGGWRRTLGKSSAMLTTDLLARLDAAEHDALERAASAYGRHLGVSVTVQARH